MKYTKTFWEREVGTIPDTGDSVEEVRALRKRMFQQNRGLEEITSM